MDAIDTAWVAGIVEGEGCFNLNTYRKKDTQRRQASMRIVVQMTDEDVVSKLCTVSGMGNVCGPMHNSGWTKPFWRWTVTAQGEVLELCDALRPHLGRRRLGQLAAMIDGFVTHKSDSRRSSNARINQLVAEKKALNFGNS